MKKYYWVSFCTYVKEPTTERFQSHYERTKAVLNDEAVVTVHPFKYIASLKKVGGQYIQVVLLNYKEITKQEYTLFRRNEI